MDTKPLPTIAERIRSSRQDHFVGRVEELELFESVLRGSGPNICLLHVSAPAGVGKTTLLREFQRRASGASSFWIDGRSIDPTTEGFLNAFNERDLESSKRLVLFVDEYDFLASLDSWMRDVFIPNLPENALVVLAGRSPLNNRWTTDPAWQELSRSIQLRNLTSNEQNEYLEMKDVPSEQRLKVIEFTRGHPLALSLVAANLAQNKDLPFESESFPQVIRVLLQRFLENVPSPLHRRALEASSSVRVTTEGLLSQLLETESGYELFEWLRSLSFMESGPDGVQPNDLAREAMAIDLRWRNPDLNAKLHEHARRYYSDRLARTRGAANQAVVRDYIYLHRDNPAVKPFFDWKFGQEAYFDRFAPEDRPGLLEMTRKHEGEESAKILDYWLSRQPENVVVLRGSGEPRTAEGFLLKLELQGLTDSDLQADPAAAAAARHLSEKAPLRKGESAILFRFWMDRELHQEVSGSQSLIFVAMVQVSLTHEHLAHTFIPCINPDFWLPIFSYSALVRLEQSDFLVGDRQFGLFGHDWRVLTPRMWLNLLAERETGITYVPSEAPRLPDVVLLSKESFELAVQEALKHFNNPQRLMTNPLLRSKVVTQTLPDGASAQDRIASLRKTIKLLSESWKVSGREAKLYDALEYGYIHPAANQDKAAERLDISIATFRRHLVTAVKRITEGLWEAEIGA